MLRYTFSKRVERGDRRKSRYDVGITKGLLELRRDQRLL